MEAGVSITPSLVPVPTDGGMRTHHFLVLPIGIAIAVILVSFVVAVSATNAEAVKRVAQDSVEWTEILWEKMGSALDEGTANAKRRFHPGLGVGDWAVIALRGGVDLLMGLTDVVASSPLLLGLVGVNIVLSSVALGLDLLWTYSQKTGVFVRSLVSGNSDLMDADEREIFGIQQVIELAGGPLYAQDAMTRLRPRHSFDAQPKLHSQARLDRGGDNSETVAAARRRVEMTLRDFYPGGGSSAWHQRAMSSARGSSLRRFTAEDLILSGHFFAEAKKATLKQANFMGLVQLRGLQQAEEAARPWTPGHARDPPRQRCGWGGASDVRVDRCQHRKE